MDELLTLKNVAASYGKLQVLRDLSFEGRVGEILLLIGHNGAGKSTVLKTIFGIVKSDRGSISLDGTDITDLTPSQRVKLGVAYMPQTSNEGRGIFPTHTVAENLELACYTSSSKEVVRRGRERAFELFPEIGDRANHRAGLLSGGQQQMLAMSMALMLDPTVLLLDEPTSGLAPSVGATLIEQVARVRDEGDIHVIVVEQNVQLAAQIADRALVLRQGEFHREVPPSAIGTASSVLDII